jgi:hypothetical protein
MSGMFDDEDDAIRDACENHNTARKAAERALKRLK